MKGAPLFVVLAAGGLFGWFAPDLAEPAPAAAGTTAAPGEDRVEVARREQWRPSEVVLSRANDGHFYAEVSVESGSVMMLVDTGATGVALTGNDASMMGVDWSESDVRPVGRGASGDVYGVPVTLESVQVGAIEVRRVRAIVVPEGLDISLLGQSFLSKVNRVEVTSDQMVLHD